MKKYSSSLLLVGVSISVAFTVYFRRNEVNLLPSEEQGRDGFFDLSSWGKESIKDFAELAISIRKELLVDETWPEVPHKSTQDEDNRTPYSSNGTRRRLMDSDKWAEEEEKMMVKMKSLYQNMKEGDQEQKQQNASSTLRGKQKHLGKRRVQGGVPDFPAYNGQCVKTSEIDCPPDDNSLPVLCDKYNGGNFEECFQTCKPSFCCTHDGGSMKSLSCADDFNCRYWTPCYIAWWKISDTIGPATFPRLTQTDDFFNVGKSYIADEIKFIENESFYAEVFGRFKDDDVVDADDIYFVDPSNWDD